MTRLLSAMRLDVTVQVRNKLYVVGIGVGIVVAVAMALLFSPDQLYAGVPTLMILVAGGSTLMYVAGLIIFERDEGTLNAVIVSPLRTTEYLWSKVITLTALATLESVVMVGGAMLIMSRDGVVPLPNIPILLGSIIVMGVIYTLLGVVLIVRYDKITDFLLPMGAIAVVLQLPRPLFSGCSHESAVSDYSIQCPDHAAARGLCAAHIRRMVVCDWLFGIAGHYVGILGLSRLQHTRYQEGRVTPCR